MLPLYNFLKLLPHLFLLVIEGLKIFIFRYKNLSLIKGVEVTIKSHLNHLVFVDHVLLFKTTSLTEWRHLKYLLHVYSQATGMNICDNKYVFISTGAHLFY